MGTGIVVGENLEQQIIDFKPRGSRICYICLKGRFFNYSIFSVYAPTDEVKDAFYDELEREVDSCFQYGISILLVDFNAQITQEKPLHSVAEYSLYGETNDNGFKLTFTMTMRLTIGSTQFPRPLGDLRIIELRIKLTIY